LLDELSRAHPEAWNILMTVLDEGQRYLSLDEDVDSPTIMVASNVSFIATANIGTEYTSTRVLDRALMDRFEIIEVDIFHCLKKKIY
jgi:MoxR-like ATPase